MKTTLSATNIIAAGVIAGAFAVGFFSGPAFADEVKFQSEDFHFKFSYEQAELATPEAASKLLTRLEGKVKRFCASEAATGTRLRKPDADCVKKTMSDTVAGFGSAVVANVYKSRASG